MARTRTLVTGAAGFTGRYLTGLLAARGHDVHGLVHHRSDELLVDSTTVHVADLAEYKAIERVVHEVQPHHVVHLAGISFVGHFDIAEMYRVNIVGTRQILEALASLESRPKSVVLASSANIYGNSREGILDETMSPAPANDYGLSKVAAEYLGQLYSKRLPIIVVRPFNYTGRGQAANFLIPKIIKSVRERAPFIELGNLNVARDFSDVRAVADTYARLLACPLATGGTYNICSGKAVSLSEILELVSNLTGHRFDVRVDSAFVRSDEVRILAGSSAKLERDIGPIAHFPLTETLRWMLED